MFQIPRRALLAVGVALAVSTFGLAQEAAPMPQVAPPAATDAESILKSLPRPPALPASLAAPAPAMSPGTNPLTVPYFVPDPLLDPPQLPPPGWFAGLELGVLKPHILNGITDTVQNTAQAANGTSTTVALPSAPLDWAVSPKVSLGYRLPAGFGELAVAYRGLASRGTEGIDGTSLGLDGAATLSSRLDFNVFDFDYSSREFAFILWPSCGMKWTVGVRVMSLYLDSQANQSFAQAAAGSGIFQMRESNSFVGVGPHAGVELSRHVADTGLSLVLGTDFTTDYGRVHQGFSTLSTTPGPDGRPLGGETRVSAKMDAPMINGKAGVSWQPPSCPNAYFFLGYQYEYWWRVGGELDTGSRADLFDQGLVLQAAFRF